MLFYRLDKHNNFWRKIQFLLENKNMTVKGEMSAFFQQDNDCLGFKNKENGLNALVGKTIRVLICYTKPVKIQDRRIG